MGAFILVILITIGTGEDLKSFEIRLNTESQSECLKDAEAYQFPLPIVSIESPEEMKVIRTVTIHKIQTEMPSRLATPVIPGPDRDQSHEESTTKISSPRSSVALLRSQVQ